MYSLFKLNPNKDKSILHENDRLKELYLRMRKKVARLPAPPEKFTENAEVCLQGSALNAADCFVNVFYQCLAPMGLPIF